MKYFIYIFFIIFTFSACTKKEFKINTNYSIKEKSDKTIFSLKQGKKLKINELVKEVAHYPVIFIGDHHNTKKTHEFLVSFLKELSKQNYNLYMMNEWFSPKHNKILREYTDGKINSKILKEKRKWNKFTKYNWQIIEPIYETIKNSKGRLYGANISKEDRKLISKKQINKMTPEIKKFYNNLDLNVSAHKNLVMPYLNHCSKYMKNKDEACQDRMYRVQVTWDKYMAQQSSIIAKNVLKTKKDKLIVFAGAMHVEYGLGIPLRFSRISNLPFYIISNKSFTKETKDLNLKQNKADAIFIYEKTKTLNMKK